MKDYIKVCVGIIEKRTDWKSLIQNLLKGDDMLREQGFSPNDDWKSFETV